jgi:hypothetical protein
LYALGLFLPALTWLFTWLYASRGHRLLIHGLEDRYIAYLTRQYAGSMLLYLLALLLSLWNALVALAVCVGLTLLYLLPPKRPTFQRHVSPA